MVAVGAGVTVGVVDVTVTTGVRVHADGRVKSEREGPVFAHQPVSINNGDQKDLRSVHLNEERSDVGLFHLWLNDERCGNFSQHLTGLNVTNLQSLLGREQFLAQHGLAGVQSVADRQAEAFAETEPLGVVRQHRSLSQDEVLLHFVDLDRVVKVVALSERVADDVAANLDALRCWRCLKGLWGGTGLVKRDEHGVQTRDNGVDEFIGLNGDSVGYFRSKGGCVGVLGHTPPFGVGLNVQVNVFPRSISVVVKRVAAHHLRDGAVLVEVGFRGLVSHPLNLKRWVVFIVCFSDLFGELEVILCSIRTCINKFNGRTVVVVNVAAHWHEHHQRAQQQCNPDTAEDGFLLVFLVSQHSHSPHTDCMQSIPRSTLFIAVRVQIV